MDTLSPHHSPVNGTSYLPFNLPHFAAHAVPLPLLNFVLAQIIKRISYKRPSIFARLRGHHHKSYLIVITNLPLQLLLQPDPSAPRLKAYRHNASPPHDAKIAGSILTLLGMVDGRYDGDALFFTRDLQVTGDTEAIVCLRNALDDMDGSIAEDAASYFGPLGVETLKIARRMGKMHDHT